MPLSACCGGYKQSPHDFCALCPIKGTVKDGEQLSRFVGFEPCNQCHNPTDCISRCKCWVLFGSEPAPAPESVLSEAARLVDGDRQTAYGHPRDNHGATAAMWTAYFARCGVLRDGAEITPRQVCIANVLQKASRDANAPSRDNLTDIAGYVANAEMAE